MEVLPDPFIDLQQYHTGFVRVMTGRRSTPLHLDVAFSIVGLTFLLDPFIRPFITTLLCPFFDRQRKDRRRTHHMFLLSQETKSLGNMPEDTQSVGFTHTNTHTRNLHGLTRGMDEVPSARLLGHCKQLAAHELPRGLGFEGFLGGT